MSRQALNVEGMTCNNCAQTVSRSMEKNGARNVQVNYLTGEAHFEIENELRIPGMISDINSLGYKAKIPLLTDPAGIHGHSHETSTVEKKFLFCLIFTVPLFLHMFFSFSFLHDPVFQFVFCLPVLVVGIIHFGKSAWGSLRIFLPNMDVLIALGSGAAFIYSLAGSFLYYGSPEVHNFLFYETAATIITLVLLGNVLEHRSVRKTTSAISELGKLQPLKAKLILEREISMGKSGPVFKEIDFHQIKLNNVLLVNTGDKIPVDGEILSGDASVDESMVTGESVPAEKVTGSKVIGGTLVLKGNIRVRAEKIGTETMLSKIIELVKNAQNQKPKIQKLGDRVSNIFVPAVVLLAILTFLISFFVFDLIAQKSLMSSIAVLVISCPCAMGLATPTAVMVGIGKAAQNGILIKGGNTLEEFAGIKQIVFDKTGTLTTGNFKIKNFRVSGTDQAVAMGIMWHLENHSSHPIARSLVRECAPFQGKGGISFTEIREEKGIGVFAADADGNKYSIGSALTVKNIPTEIPGEIYLVKNNKIIASLDVEDEIKLSARRVILDLKRKGIKIILLSGDKKSKCDEVSEKLNIDETYSEKLPDEKLEIIERLSSRASTAMVGDGINDAPALARATVGISLRNATQTAIHSSQIVLLRENDLSGLMAAYTISTATMKTIKQNLFWAFFYNVLAIPVAAFGMLSPMIGALSMAFSDVIVIGNSLRLKTKSLH